GAGIDFDQEVLTSNRILLELDLGDAAILKVPQQGGGDIHKVPRDAHRLAYHAVSVLCRVATHLPSGEHAHCVVIPVDIHAHRVHLVTPPPHELLKYQTRHDLSVRIQERL